MKRLLILFLCGINLCQAQEIEFDIYFDSGKFTLSSQHQKKINTQLADLDSTTTYNFVIKGYTDFVDTEHFNLELSENRATTVANYLKEHYESFINSIEQEAKGELPTETTKQNERIGVKKHRKVSISASKNDHKPKVVERKENIYVVPINELRVGNTYALGKINFKTGRVTLIKSSKKELEKLVRFLKKNRNIHIEVQGHVCCGGDDDSDALNSETGTETLSVDRARFIYKYLISRGISKERLTYKGYAFKAPLRFPEKGSRDRSANRRVEIEITKN
ncbi:OmpA family protein [Kordia algicida OT-1]|uniref:OmpA/MotB n=1 Tax=Kordia algicida OT-1 TaxID=391587 RepID=A9E3N3_9FLAO|nr:OmpA family protein [Kordia algicida]EDP95243.1 OmpA/MotB [Kordia algicida OT-1]